MANILLISSRVAALLGFILYTLFEILRGLVLLCVPATYEPVKTVAGEIILITGAGSGLGRQLAIKLARKQAKIVIWDIDVKGLEDTYKMIKDAGGTVHHYKCDLTKREEVYDVAEQVTKDVGDVTILINNAGVTSGYWLWEIPDHLIQRTFDVNSIALFWTAKAFLPKMIQENRGHIVTIASMAGHTACSKLCDYSASKFAAYGFDEGLRLDLAAKGITGVKTTVVCPYFIAQTGMFNDVVSALPTLSVDVVAERTILGITREDLVIMLPAYFRFTFWLKWFVPWSVVSKFVIGMVPDAVPKQGSFVKY
ncbi:dehydrogenase [Oryctes borbonicus]|uniref:Dehydrogenase n=1 Tax=Oryctes borbonicus TaxID=1629725 RepID=A0A0T6B235_9SCAR|nr:dehydrogenase [Oryctes borbonicus]